MNNGRVQQAIVDPLLTGDIQGIVADGEYYGMTTFDQSLVQPHRGEGVPTSDEAMSDGHQSLTISRSCSSARESCRPGQFADNSGSDLPLASSSVWRACCPEQWACRAPFGLRH